MGQGGNGEPSVGGPSRGMGTEAKEEMRSRTGPRASVREWWAGFGTVTGALEGLGEVGFWMEGAGLGKCFFL